MNKIRQLRLARQQTRQLLENACGPVRCTEQELI
jgi:hypothetical protein